MQYRNISVQWCSTSPFWSGGGLPRVAGNGSLHLLSFFMSSLWKNNWSSKHWVFHYCGFGGFRILFGKIFAHFANIITFCNIIREYILGIRNIDSPARNPWDDPGLCERVVPQYNPMYKALVIDSTFKFYFHRNTNNQCKTSDFLWHHKNIKNRHLPNRSQECSLMCCRWQWQWSAFRDVNYSKIFESGFCEYTGIL